jgi:hypothetical protein
MNKKIFVLLAVILLFFSTLEIISSIFYLFKLKWLVKYSTKFKSIKQQNFCYKILKFSLQYISNIIIDSNVAKFGTFLCNFIIIICFLFYLDQILYKSDNILYI